MKNSASSDFLAKSKTGETATTLIFLPGLDGTEVLFRPLLEALPKSIRARVVCFPASGSNDYEFLLREVRHAIADLTEFYIVAWSFSGPVALMLANAEPARVRGIVFFASFVRAPLRFLPPLRFATVTPVIWFIRAARRVPLWLRHAPTDPLRRAKAELWRRVPARILAARLRAIVALDASEWLRLCQVPILYVAGSNDNVVPRRNLDEIVRIKPSTQVRVIAGDHFAIYRNPAAGSAAIESFVGVQK